MRLAVTTLEPAEAAIRTHYQTAEMEPGLPMQVQLWHLLYSLIEYCEATGIDFDAELADVRQAMEADR